MQNKKLHESDTLQALAYENCKFSFQVFVTLSEIL